MICKMQPRVLYQKFPKRLKKAFLLGAGCIVATAIYAFCFRAYPPVFWMGMICLGFASLLTLYVIVQAIAIRQPMLTLSDAYLTYRKRNIPWSDITAVTALDLPGFRAVGIVLASPAASAPYQKSIARYGAIPIRAARGLSIEELREIVTGYWLASGGPALPASREGEVPAARVDGGAVRTWWARYVAWRERLTPSQLGILVLVNNLLFFAVAYRILVPAVLHPAPLLWTAVALVAAATGCATTLRHRAAMDAYRAGTGPRPTWLHDARSDD